MNPFRSKLVGSSGEPLLVYCVMEGYYKIEREILYNCYVTNDATRDECWPIKKQQVCSKSVAEMRWMCDKIRENIIRNETMREMVRVVPMQDKLRRT